MSDCRRKGDIEIVDIEIDVLRDVKRMCITDDFKELSEMYRWVSRRLYAIFDMNLKRLMEVQDE